MVVRLGQVSERRRVGEEDVGGFAAAFQAGLPLGQRLNRSLGGGVHLPADRVREPRIVQLDGIAEFVDRIRVAVGLRAISAAMTRA